MTKDTKKKKQLPPDQQVLTYASSVHQLCKQHSSKSPRLAPALGIIQEAMESLSQTVMASSNSSSSKVSSSLEPIIKETKKISGSVTRLCNLHPVLQTIESPALLQDLHNSMITLQAALPEIKSNSRLPVLVEQAQKDKTHLLSDDGALANQIRASTASPKELLRLLQRHKRVLFKESVHEQRDSMAKDVAKKELHYVDQLLIKIPKVLDEGNMDTSAASSAMQDESLSTLAPSPLPSWAVCPISKKIMLDPVTVRADCNHTLSKSVFSEWLKADNKTCPVCGCNLKALYAKSNTQLKWKVQEMEHDKSFATIAVAHPTTSQDGGAPVVTSLRRFSTGDFTSRKTVVAAAETKKSAAERTPPPPQPLRGEGATKQKAETAATKAPQLERIPPTSATAVTGPTDGSGSAKSNDKRDEFHRQQSQETQVTDNSSGGPRRGRKKTEEELAKLNPSTTTEGAKKNKGPGAKNVREEQPMEDGSSNSLSGSAVHFSSTVVTKYIERPEDSRRNASSRTTTERSTTEGGHTKIVSTYPMIDRSDRGKRKNPVKHLLGMLRGGGGGQNRQSQHHHHKKNSPPLASAKVILELNTSNTTTMTADLSSSSNHHQSGNIVSGSNHSTSSSTSTAGPSILKKNGKHSTSAFSKKKDRSSLPPPLVPMKAANYIAT